MAELRGRIREQQRSARDFAAAVRTSPILMSLEYTPSPSLASADTLPGYSATSLQGFTSTANSVAELPPSSSVARGAEGSETDRIPSRQNDLASIHAGVKDISARIAHSTLQQLEMAEAAGARDYFHPTIYALELAHRIENDKSPASMMQLGWRRARLERFIHAEIGYLSGGGGEKDMDATRYSYYSIVEAAGQPLARIAARQLLRRGHCFCKDFDPDCPVNSEKLVIRNIQSSSTKKEVETGLRR